MLKVENEGNKRVVHSVLFLARPATLVLKNNEAYTTFRLEKIDREESVGEFLEKKAYLKLYHFLFKTS